VGSIRELHGCAKHHLDHYTSPQSTRSFATYDIQGDPTSFDPLDALAPTLLAARVRSDTIKRMFAGDSKDPHTILRKSIEHLLGEVAGAPSTFLNDLSPHLNQARQPVPVHWELVLECFAQVRPKMIPYIRATTLSKMIHRKLPHLVPIVDSKVARFYGLKNADDPIAYFDEFRNDRSADHTAFLIGLLAGRKTPDGRDISVLRAHDIIIWEHVVTNCRFPSGPLAVCGYPNACGFCYPRNV
jgi:hypothetical protein